MTFDTGIVTLHRSANFGAFLQAFALQQTLTALGCKPQFIETEHEPRLLRLLKREAMKLRQEGLFRYRHAQVMRKAVEAHLRTGGAASDRYRTVFVGSDEVWSVRNPNFRSPPEFFGIGLNAGRVCSYAPSMGQSGPTDLGGSEARIAALRGFHALSGRDDGTVAAVSSVTGRDVVKVLDPTLLVDWTPYVVPFGVPGALVVYTYRFDDTVVAQIRKYAKAEGLRIVAVGMGQPWADDVITASPFEFLGLLQSAAAVVTDTFHGSIMSSLVGANFAIVELGAKKKLTQLIGDLGLHDRVAKDGLHLEAVLSRRFDNRARALELAKARERSIDYLAACLAA